MLIVVLSLIVVIAVVGGIFAGTDENPRPSLDAQVQQLSKSLREQIIPSVGTPRAEVDEVFGEPKEVPQLTGLKGDPDDYPMHVYQLLDPVDNSEFRAALLVTYRDGTVYRASINHVCVAKGRLAYAQTPPEVTADIERENRWALVDLLEIYDKHKVTKAPLNAPVTGK